MIGEVPEEPASDRPRNEANSEEHRGVQLLNDRIIPRKKRIGEVQSERRVDIEVIPLDQISDGVGEDSLHTPTDIGKIEAVVFYLDRRSRHITAAPNPDRLRRPLAFPKLGGMP